MCVTSHLYLKEYSAHINRLGERGRAGGGRGSQKLKGSKKIKGMIHTCEQVRWGGRREGAGEGGRRGGGGKKSRENTLREEAFR